MQARPALGAPLGVQSHARLRSPRTNTDGPRRVGAAGGEGTTGWIKARRWPVRFVRAAALCRSACASEGASALPFMWLPGFATVPSGVREYCRTVLFSSNRYRSTQSSSCSTTCSRCSRMKRWVVAVLTSTIIGRRRSALHHAPGAPCRAVPLGLCACRSRTTHAMRSLWRVRAWGRRSGACVGRRLLDLEQPPHAT